ncbi:MAG: hypothetical protein GXO87_10280, partial [Chlorobi bacterium]|nr:hypothetical protein [Chlorobiota bacterium]
NSRKIFIALAFVGTVLFFGCDIDYSSHMGEENTRPIPGEINVGFADSLDQWFVESFLDTMDVEILDKTFGYRAYVRVDSGAAWFYKEKIEDMQNVVSVWVYYHGADEKKFLSIVFNGMVDTIYAYRIIGSFNYLTLINIYVFTPRVKLRVEIGTENEWIAKFEEYPFVVYAEQVMEYY